MSEPNERTAAEEEDEVLEPAEAFAGALLERLERGEVRDLTQELSACAPDIRDKVRSILEATRSLYEQLGASLPSLPLPAGRVQGYRLGQLLGEGGMARVYEAVNEANGRQVALKLIDKISAPQHLVRRFREEMVWSAIDHPRVVVVHHAGASDHHLFLEMERMQGPSLAAVLAAVASPAEEPLLQLPASGPLRAAMGLPDPAALPLDPHERIRRPEYWRWCCRVGMAVAEALQAAHDAGIVHRDVKPSNVLFSGAGEAKLGDFGLAKREGDLHSLTQSGERPGTMAFMSPEQIEPPPGGVDRRTDVYSLGVTLYQMLTLRLPFEAPTPSALARDACLREAPPVRKHNEGVPSDLVAVVGKCLQKMPRHRYQSAAEVMQDLERVLQGRRTQAETSSWSTTAWRRLARDRTLRRFVVGILGTLTILVGGLIWHQHDRESRREASFGQLQASYRKLMVTAQAVAREDGLHVARPAWHQLPRIQDAALALAGSRAERCAVWTDRLAVACSVRDIPVVRSTLDLALRDQEGHLTPGLRLQCAEAALLCDPQRAPALLKPLVEKTPHAGSPLGPRARELASLLTALGTPGRRWAPGVFDARAAEADLGPERLRICVGPGPSPYRPHVWLWRSGGGQDAARDLGAIGPTAWDSDPIAPFEYSWVAVLQTRASSGDALYGLLHVRDLQYLIRVVPQGSGAPRLDVLAKCTPWETAGAGSGDPRLVHADLTLLERSPDGAPRSALLTVREAAGAPTLAPIQLRITRAQETWQCTRQFLDDGGRTRTNGCATNAPDGECLALGQGEWGGFGLHVRRKGPDGWESGGTQRVGHVSGLSPLIDDGKGRAGFVFCKSNRLPSSAYFGDARPYGWDRGVYACAWQRDGGFPWRVAAADLDFDPQTPEASSTCVADVRMAGRSLVFVIDLPGPGQGTELRVYDLPDLGATVSTSPWIPLLALRSPEMGPVQHFQGPLLRKADLDGDGDDEVFVWAQRPRSAPPGIDFGIVVLGLP